MKLSKKGQSNLVAGTVAIVTVVVLLFISILLVSQVRSSITRTYADATENVTGQWDAEDNATWDNVVNNSNTAFTLLAIALIVMVAFLIIGILRGSG